MTISGSGSGTFQIKAEPNTGKITRSAVITFTNASGLSYDATFREVAEILSPDPGECFMDQEGETVRIEVTANVIWTVSKDEGVDWIELMPHNVYFDIKVLANTTGEIRTTNILLKGEYTEVLIKVAQLGKKAWTGNPIPALTGDLRTDIVAVAKSQEGVKEEDGIEDKNPYSREVTGTDGHAWCGDFVAWVFKNASPNVLAQYVVHSWSKLPNEVPVGDGWNVSLAPNWALAATDRWKFYPALQEGNEQPVDVRIGDVVVWSKHVAIVTDVNNDAKLIKFVGGNQGGSVTEVKDRSRDKPDYNGTFLGYTRLLPLTEVE